MKPLVLHMRATNFFGGPEKQIMGHIATSRNARHTVLTFIERGFHNELLDRCKQKGIPVETIATQSPYNPSSVIKLRRILKRVRPAIICSHGYKPAILVLLARVGLNMPLVMFARGHTSENAKVRFFERLELVVLSYADAVVSVSRGYAESLFKYGLSQGFTHIVHNAIDTNTVNSHIERAKLKRKELGFSSEDILIATAGRLSPEKAQSDLIVAFKKIQSQYPDTHVLLLGDGPLRSELETMARGLNGRNIHFLGFRHDVDEIISAIDLFVLPSLMEGLPNVLLEAFARAKPVVATTVGGVPELVEDGVNGFLVPPGCPDLLAEAIARFISSPEMRLRYGETGFRKVKAEFTLESQTRQLEKIYYRLSATAEGEVG